MLGLAESSPRILLSRDYKWNPSRNNGNPFYWGMFSYFRDEKLATYSVKQILVMGVSEGISIGK